MAEFDNPLILSSPYMIGKRVNDAQYLLKGNNRFPGLAPFKDGKIDGIYGPQTALATKSAKYWLGYPNSGINETFGQTLYEYLRVEKWRPLPQEYRERRSARLAAAALTPGKKALDFAINEIGNHESPWGSNLQKYGQWYGFNGVPWCAIFESYCFAHTGKTNYRYSYCGYIYYDAVRGRNGLKLVWTPQPGDVVVYNLHGDPFAHTAFFEKWITQGSSFYDVGGNTGPTNVSNGGAVMRQERNVGIVSHFIRVT